MCGLETEGKEYRIWPVEGQEARPRGGGECEGDGEERMSEVSDSMLSETSASVGESSASVEEMASTVEKAKATLFSSGDRGGRIEGREGR